MNDRANAVREDVARVYAERVTKTGEASLERELSAEGLAIAGYTPEQLVVLPDEATESSFGCGNPVAFAGLRAGQVVLDLGCGAGMDLLLAAQKVGPAGRVIGIDMTDEMLAKANENIRRAGLTNVEVRKGLIEDLPIEDGSVDWVISNCVINLSPEKPKVFREIARVLKPGGAMFISDIVVEQLPDIAKPMMQKLYAYCVAGAISEERYVAGLQAEGLADVAVRGRLVYEAAQIERFIGELGLDPEQAAGFARAMEGKVWSARVYARKPE